MARKITLSRLYGGGYAVDTVDGGAGLTVQTDYDFVGLAETFGMVARHKPRCADRGLTDGTIDCPSCGQTVSAFIAQALNYLDEHDGAIVADPGYFGDMGL